MIEMKKNKIEIKSQKGAAIVLVATLVAGIVMLVSIIVIENLRKSISLQGIQKRSLDSLFKAEEGIEYGLYINKEKEVKNFERPFKISIWEKINQNTVIKNDNQALEQLMQPKEERNIVITSQNDENQNSSPQRTIFTNLPSKYQDQVPLWSIREGCEKGCTDSYQENDMEEGKTYRIVINSIFERASWSEVEWEYRLIFKCGGTAFWETSLPSSVTTENCELSNVKLAIDCGDPSLCNVDNCIHKDKSVNFANGEDIMEGKIIPTEWFKVTDSSGELINLTNKKIIVEFKLEQGTMEEVLLTTGTEEKTKMCRSNGGEENPAWEEFRDRRGGLASFEIRKARNIP